MREPGARQDKPHRNVALPGPELHNAGMGVAMVFFDFLERIAIGAVAVLALFLVIQIGIPRRSRTAVTRRTTN